METKNKQIFGNRRENNQIQYKAGNFRQERSGIDKLHLRPIDYVDIDRVRLQAKRLDIVCVPRTKNFRTWFVLYISKENKIRLGYSPRTRQLHLVTLNPLRFESYTHLNSLLVSLFGIEIKLYSVTRIDFAINILKPIGEIKKGFSVKWKQICRTYDTRKRHTGQTYGSIEKQITLYDYNERHRPKEKLPPETRLEARFSLKKNVPIDEYRDLIALPDLLRLGAFCPFKGVSFQEVLLKNKPSVAQVDAFTKFINFKVYLEAYGLDRTRKELGRNNNFQRDYGKYYKALNVIDDFNIPLAEALEHYFRLRTKKGRTNGD